MESIAVRAVGLFEKNCFGLTCGIEIRSVVDKWLRIELRVDSLRLIRCEILKNGL